MQISKLSIESSKVETKKIKVESDKMSEEDEDLNYRHKQHVTGCAGLGFSSLQAHLRERLIFYAFLWHFSDVF